MFCSNCGNNNNETAHFCVYCGSSLEGTKKVEPTIAKAKMMVENAKQKEGSKKVRGRLRGWHIALICAGGALWLILQLAIINGSAAQEKADPEKILYETYQNYIGSGKTVEEYQEEQAVREEQTKQELQEQQTEERPQESKAQGGAASLEELEMIFSSNYLYSEAQINCATTFTHLWGCTDLADSADSTDSALRAIANRDIQKICDMFKPEMESKVEISIGEYIECENDEIYSSFSSLSQAIKLAEEFCWGDSLEETVLLTIAKTLMEEKENIEGVWRAAYSVFVEGEGQGQVSAEESDLFIYKINGRYYWQIVEG